MQVNRLQLKETLCHGQTYKSRNWKWTILGGSYLYCIKYSFGCLKKKKICEDFQFSRFFKQVHILAAGGTAVPIWQN